MWRLRVAKHTGFRVCNAVWYQVLVHMAAHPWPLMHARYLGCTCARVAGSMGLGGLLLADSTTHIGQSAKVDRDQLVAVSGTIASAAGLFNNVAYTQFGTAITKSPQ
ncbi:hypothetical protein THASP1DRAFT_26653 [Thamnocephalis sphaerospora]|uniref:Uncharacterized protein n=1 Tax=Thamnocephalis sphaerospora TaxID=78915 RepID=A0A4P9XHR5_9FUNG|nr:hypothetical protein THASP1DRAFT_26653 [Thamnocephalis sphaerospora]|eukprot:RKP04760.1 hypothetical protein THASP1DRAFT_26653 [Thamnocephalis sphaerospora]